MPHEQLSAVKLRMRVADARLEREMIVPMPSALNIWMLVKFVLLNVVEDEGVLDMLSSGVTEVSVTLLILVSEKMRVPDPMEMKDWHVRSVASVVIVTDVSVSVPFAVEVIRLPVVKL